MARHCYAFPHSTLTRAMSCGSFTNLSLGATAKWFRVWFSEAARLLKTGGCGRCDTFVIHNTCFGGLSLPPSLSDTHTQGQETAPKHVSIGWAEDGREKQSRKRSPPGRRRASPGPHFRNQVCRVHSLSDPVALLIADGTGLGWRCVIPSRSQGSPGEGVAYASPYNAPCRYSLSREPPADCCVKN